VFIDVQFNPTELSFEKSVSNADINIPGLDTPLLQFVRGNAEKLTLELFFDTTDLGMGPTATSVTTLTDLVYGLIKIDPDGHAPPVCSFLWNPEFPGADVQNIGNQLRNEFQCIVESVRQKFTFFSPTGIPLRATLSVTLREYKTLDQQLSQLNLNSPNRTQSWIIQSGDTLSSIAGQLYQDPTQWRYIATANDIEDPRRLQPGTFLTMPPIT
jgi:hypothetical protein